MERMYRAVPIAIVAVLLSPTVSLAAEVATRTSPLRLGISLVGLLVAAALLVEALRVRRVSLGGAIAERMSYVILAILCLAGSAVGAWARNFVAGFTEEQIQVASEALVIVAMGLLAAYFYSVRTALQSYLKAMTGTEMTPTTPPDQQDEEE